MHKIFGFVILIILTTVSLNTAHAGLIDDLKSKIQNRNSQLEQIKKEEEALQQEVQKVIQEKQTLQTAVQQLDLSKRRLEKDINATESQIGTAELTIEQLSLEIKEIEEDVSESKEALGESIRAVNSADNESMIESLLTHDTLTEVWDRLASLSQFRESIRDRVASLENLKINLNDKVASNISTKANLENFQEELDDQKQVVLINKQTKDELLTQTKNEEAEYNRLLAQKRAQREQFERELFDLESQLNIAIDPSRLPAAGSGVLRWPLDSFVITQQFGRTADSGRLYASGTHNGVDFGVAQGTPVKSAASGTVSATGNTDNGTCLSYGKWVLVEHPNGLSTLYAHLSLVKAVKGQAVNMGEVIGYSGNTGYSTGPHLHLTVYATQGVRVQQYSNSINCKNVTIPIADPKAYLDPMQYL